MELRVATQLDSKRAGAPSRRDIAGSRAANRCSPAFPDQRNESLPLSTLEELVPTRFVQIVAFPAECQARQTKDLKSVLAFPRVGGMSVRHLCVERVNMRIWR